MGSGKIFVLAFENVSYSLWFWSVMNKLEQFKCSIFTPLKNQQKESFKEFEFFDEQKITTNAILDNKQTKSKGRLPEKCVAKYPASGSTIQIENGFLLLLLLPVLVYFPGKKQLV